MKKILLALSLMVPVLSHAASLDDLRTGEFGSKKNFEVVAGTNTQLMNVKYILKSGNASATVSLLNSVMTFQSPSGTNDSNIGNNGVFTITGTTVDTLGELCDAINNVKVSGNQSYLCTLLAGNRNDSSQLLKNTNLAGVLNADISISSGYSFYMSTAVFDGIGIQPRPGHYIRLHTCSWNSKNTDPFGVFGSMAKLEADTNIIAGDYTKALDIPNFLVGLVNITNFNQTVGTGTLVGATLQQPGSIVIDNPIDFGLNEHVVVRNSLGNTLTAENGDDVSPGRNFLSCVWEER